jgi:23S rRNA pseudouridine2605 synthase
VNVRLQKVLAAAGVGSRRACEEMIREGRVTVDGHTASIGMSVDPQAQQIRLDGARVKPAEAPVYIAVYKPVGVLSSTVSQGGKPTILDVVEVPKRMFPVGRLDVDSEGLMLLTNDGELTQKLTHPKYGKEKEYRVLLDGLPTSEQIERWREGVRLSDGTRALAASVRPEGSGAWVRVVMRQGRKRQIRDTARVLGLGVRRLIRIRIGGLRLGNLKPGEWRMLDAEEVRSLRAGGRPSQAHRGKPMRVPGSERRMEERG